MPNAGSLNQAAAPYPLLLHGRISGRENKVRDFEDAACVVPSRSYRWRLARQLQHVMILTSEVRVASRQVAEVLSRFRRGWAGRQLRDAEARQLSCGLSCERDMIPIPVAKVDDVAFVRARLANLPPWGPFATHVEVQTIVVLHPRDPLSLSYIPNDGLRS